MRPGRLDRILYVGPPDLDGRKEILRIRTSKMSVEPGLDFDEVAKMVRLFPFTILQLLGANDALTRPMDVRVPRLLHFVRKRHY